jgi:hypothetical protein
MIEVRGDPNALGGRMKTPVGKVLRVRRRDMIDTLPSKFRHQLPVPAPVLDPRLILGGGPCLMISGGPCLMALEWRRLVLLGARCGW